MKGEPPPPYPRIPLVAAVSGAQPDDLLASKAERGRILTLTDGIEEKLDGASVCLWLDQTRAVQVAGRSGPGGMDRARQVGRLKAWAGERVDSLRSLLDHCHAIYGEWLWRRHSIFYDALPDFLIVTDLWSETTGFFPLDERDELAWTARLATPPMLARKAPVSVAGLSKLIGRSRFGHEVMEGLILRARRGPPLGKYVAPGFRRVSDQDWAKGRGTNQLDPTRRS